MTTATDSLANLVALSRDGDKAELIALSPRAQARSSTNGRWIPEGTSNDIASRDAARTGGGVAKGDKVDLPNGKTITVDRVNHHFDGPIVHGKTTDGKTASHQFKSHAELNAASATRKERFDAFHKKQAADKAAADAKAKVDTTKAPPDVKVGAKHRPNAAHITGGSKEKNQERRDAVRPALTKGAHVEAMDGRRGVIQDSGTARTKVRSTTIKWDDNNQLDGIDLWKLDTPFTRSKLPK